MPIYEFECEECGARFDRLVDAGTESTSCEACGSENTVRRYSAQAASFKVVKSRGDARKQEARNAVLHKNTKDAFKARRKAQREAQARSKSSGSDG